MEAVQQALAFDVPVDTPPWDEGKDEQCQEDLPTPEQMREPGEDDGPKVKARQDVIWRIWRFYDELEQCPEEDVPKVRAAIAYLGGSLHVRYPIPNSIRKLVAPNIPVRKPKEQ